MNSPDEHVTDEIIRQAELRLSAQMALAIAADQRAMSLTAAAAALAAAAFGLALSQPDQSSESPLFVATCIVGVLFSVAAGLAAWSARPSAFAVPGFYPSTFADDLAVEKPIVKIKREIADLLEARLQKNRSLMAGNSRLLATSLILMALAPALAITWILMVSALPTLFH